VFLINASAKGFLGAASVPAGVDRNHLQSEREEQKAGVLFSSPSVMQLTSLM
jgi:hypothetical protein